MPLAVLPHALFQQCGGAFPGRAFAFVVARRRWREDAARYDVLDRVITFGSEWYCAFDQVWSS